MTRMIAHTIPGLGTLRLQHLVLDFNGTLALDGRLLPGVRPRLRRLARRLELHVVTADTFGSVRRVLTGLAPDVLAALLEAGAEPQDLAARLHGEREPGDEDLLYLGVRRAIIEALSEIEGIKASEVLVAAMKDPDPEVRRAAADSLGARD